MFFSLTTCETEDRCSPEQLRDHVVTPDKTENQAKIANGLPLRGALFRTKTVDAQTITCR